jgi:predicted lipoprotein with Yx(FWY)xxD motif
MTGMQRRVRTAGLTVAACLLAAGCGGEPSTPAAATTSSSSSSSAAPTSAAATTEAPPSPSPAAAGQVVTTDGSDYGTMLFDDVGQAIYLFDRETTSTPDCYDDCAVDWPPVLTDGAPVAAGEVRAELLGTTPRQDGSVQVTYAGHPLYYYAHEDPGQVFCRDGAEYGGVWLVVTPAGTPAP